MIPITDFYIQYHSKYCIIQIITYFYYELRKVSYDVLLQFSIFGFSSFFLQSWLCILILY